MTTTSERIFRARTVALVALTTAIGGNAAFAATVLVGDPCDVTIVAPGQAVGVAGAVEAAPGDTVQLTMNGLCNPSFTASATPGVGTLLTGNGITVAAAGVTLDLNGYSIHSAFDVATAAAAQGLDVENTGVSVGARNVTVTNTSSAQSLIDNFTANFDLKAENSAVRGSMVGGASNIKGGDAHGGGAMAIDKSKGLLIDSLELDDTTGDNGIDLKRSEDVRITNSKIHGVLNGVRVRLQKLLSLRDNTISSVNGTGVELRGVDNSADPAAAKYSVSGNVIENSALDGVNVGLASKQVSITNNTIRNNGGCGITVSPDSTKIVTSPNTFLDNAGGSACVK